MMISPESFIKDYNGMKYLDLLRVRDDLIDEIQVFEMREDDLEWENGRLVVTHPSPEVVYQMNLQYLAKLCELISTKYNQEYVWGNASSEEECD